jgi:glycosyltransferase involved in cell wall biosynthesis
MKFSVLLNNYNYARYLGAAIESVLAQTFPDLELLIVDDGSTDASREIIEGYRDPRIVRIFQSNGGQASAFLAGIHRAKGEYLAFLDSDDTWEPNKLAQCLEILDRDSEISVLCHGYRVVDGESREIGSRPNPPSSGYFDAMAAYRRYTLELPFSPTSFICARTSAARQVVLDPQRWRLCADVPLYVGLSTLGKVYIMDEILGSYRRHQSNGWLGGETTARFMEYGFWVCESANANLRAQGRDEPVLDFKKSGSYSALMTVLHPAWRWTGLYHRLRYRWMRLTKRDSI